MTPMAWASILLWLLVNLPDIIALIKRFWDRLNEKVSLARKEEIRLELSGIIRDKSLKWRERRKRARAVITRVLVETGGITAEKKRTPFRW